MLRIVTDGAGDILPGWGKEFGIDVIPVNILFGEKTYLQGIELDNEGFYKLVDETKRIPKTAQPSPHQFVEFYRKVAQKGDTIISLHITAKLSGTYASAVAAAEELKDEFNPGLPRGRQRPGENVDIDMLTLSCGEGCADETDPEDKVSE